MEGTITGHTRATSVRRVPLSPRSSIPTLQHPVLDTMEPDNVDQLVASKTEHSSSAAHTPQEVEVLPNRTPAPRTRKGIRHWLIIFSVLLCLFLSALEFVRVLQILPLARILTTSRLACPLPFRRSYMTCMATILFGSGRHTHSPRPPCCLWRVEWPRYAVLLRTFTISTKKLFARPDLRSP